MSQEALPPGFERPARPLGGKTLEAALMAAADRFSPKGIGHHRVDVEVLRQTESAGGEILALCMATYYESDAESLQSLEVLVRRPQGLAGALGEGEFDVVAVRAER